MKCILWILLCAGLVSACATTKTTRHPSSLKSSDVLSDQYGDTLVYFCEDGQAVVESDPNRCGEAKAKGKSGCTEAAVYFSGKLDIDDSGERIALSSGAHKIHELQVLGDGRYILFGRRQGKMGELSARPSDANEQSHIKRFVCN